MDYLRVLTGTEKPLPIYTGIIACLENPLVFADLIEPDVLSRLRISHFFAKPLDLDTLNRSIDYLLRKDELATGRLA